MKRILLSAPIWLWMVGGTLAQVPSIPFMVGNPPAASVIGVSYNHYVSAAVGGKTFYYWVVTTYTGGSVLYPTSYEVDNINSSDPSGAHPITISFNPVQGAITYSVLRTTLDIQPSFPCVCLVGTTSGATFAVDSGAALGAFAPTFITPATGDIRLNNKDYTPPVFESIVNGVTTPLSNIACVGSPGNTINVYRGQCQTSGATPVVYVCKNTAGCTVAADWYASVGSGSFVTLSGDATSTAVGGATTVTGVNGVQFSGLATGILKNTITSGVPSIAVAADFPMLGVAQGGTGLATLTAHALYVGNGTTAPTALAVGATDKPLVGVTGANPAFSKLTLTNPATSATITIADGKTFTVNNIMTLAGTDSQTYTFPSTSATIARTDAANTFTGVQTMTSPVLTTPVITTNLHAATAGGATVGSALLPFSGVFIGSATTNNIELTGTSAAGRVVTIPDIGTNTGATVVLSPTSTTVTQVLHATDTAGLYSPAAIVAADLPEAYIPYTGATEPVDLGVYGATGSSFTTNGDTSGTLQLSGIASGVVTGTLTQTVNDTTGTWTLTWPTSAGTSGYVLSTDGAGVTSWVAKSTGFTGTKTAGSCTFTIVNGIITNVTGC